MIPPQIESTVSVSVLKLFVDIKKISSKLTRNVQAIIIIQFVIQLSI